jgi:hypothetical protein
MTNDNEILAPNCKIVEMVILNPKKYRSLRVIRNIDALSYKTGSTAYSSVDYNKDYGSYNKDYNKPGSLNNNTYSNEAAGGFKDYKSDYKPLSNDTKDQSKLSPVTDMKDYKQDYKSQDYKPQDYKQQDYKPQDYKPQDYKPQVDYKPQDYKPQDYKSQEYSKGLNTANAKNFEDISEYSYKKNEPYTYDNKEKPSRNEPDFSTNDLMKSDEKNFPKFNDMAPFKSYDKYSKDNSINNITNNTMGNTGNTNQGGSTTPLSFNYKKPDSSPNKYNFTSNSIESPNNNFISITDNLNIDRTSTGVMKSPTNNYMSKGDQGGTGNSNQTPFNYTDRLNNEFSNNRQRFSTEKRAYSRGAGGKETNQTSLEDKYGKYNPDGLMSERGGSEKQLDSLKSGGGFAKNSSNNDKRNNVNKKLK